MAPTNQTVGRLVPLTNAIRRAMAEQDQSFRSLAKQTAANGVRGGRGLTSGYLGAVTRGDDRPSLEAIEAICEALDLDPATIAEHQLAVTRRLFDERPPPIGVGYDEALANLARLVIDDTHRVGPVTERVGDGAGPETLEVVEVPPPRRAPKPHSRTSRTAPAAGSEPRRAEEPTRKRASSRRSR